LLRIDQEILTSLRSIEIGVHVLIVLLAISVVANLVRSILLVKNQVRRDLNQVFEDETGELHDKGCFDELIFHCNEVLSKKPNHSYALWYIAKAYLQKEEYLLAKENFTNLAKLQPSWEESHIRPYLDKIENALDD
jgi:hypothetical protein